MSGNTGIEPSDFHERIAPRWRSTPELIPAPRYLNMNLFSCPEWMGEAHHATTWTHNRKPVGIGAVYTELDQ